MTMIATLAESEAASIQTTIAIIHPAKIPRNIAVPKVNVWVTPLGYLIVIIGRQPKGAAIRLRANNSGTELRQ
jgi:hypothetical protein